MSKKQFYTNINVRKITEMNATTYLTTVQTHRILLHVIRSYADLNLRESKTTNGTPYQLGTIPGQLNY